MIRNWLYLLVAISLLAPDSKAIATKIFDPDSVNRLETKTVGKAKINAATGTVRLAKIKKAPHVGPSVASRSSLDDDAVAQAFLRTHGGAFGVSQPASELELANIERENSGQSHLRYDQIYNGIPVFGASIKVHLDENGDVNVINGSLVPGITVDPNPTRTARDAEKLAHFLVGEQTSALALRIQGTKLLIYREGFARGIEGPNHLSWEIEVGDGGTIREFLYIDAHTGKLIDQISGIHDSLNLKVYDGENKETPGPNFPDNPYWSQGDAFPTQSQEANNIIRATQASYNFFMNVLNRDSFDGLGSPMIAVFNRGDKCPNASWNGTLISFCPGLTADDVTAHEWAHAYTDYSNDLIYAWQSGALNEAYSDIWGETIDMNDGFDLTSPQPVSTRTNARCSFYKPVVTYIDIQIADSESIQVLGSPAEFGPKLDKTGLASGVALVNDGVGDAAIPVGSSGTSLWDGCETPYSNQASMAGKIALVYRSGRCAFTQQVKNAQNMGAVGVIVANHIVDGEILLNTMQGSDTTIRIPSVFVANSVGFYIQTKLNTNLVRVTLLSTNDSAKNTDKSYRWLMGEDGTAAGLSGAIRDLWSPDCFSSPKAVDDTRYWCDDSDNGGVHTNSSIPARAYAMLVDGSSSNTAIGFAKAAAIYWRSQSVYETPATDFSDHADLLELSCNDLVGKPIRNLNGTVATSLINSNDCAQVESVIGAVQLRSPPSQCSFQTLLQKNPPPFCERSIFFANFEGSTNGFSVSHSVVDFPERNWVLANTLPNGHMGSAFFATGKDLGSCTRGKDATGVLYLVSPIIKLPNTAGPFILSFEHYVATEAEVDGGIVEISKDGINWTQVASTDFIYNPYNATLASASSGNSNPLAGKKAFTGADDGLNSGSFGFSQIKLANYAKKGDSIRIRFSFGTDGCGGIEGWYVDNVGVFDTTPGEIVSTCGLGQCARSGASTCLNGVLTSNACLPGDPSAEICDGLDNNCDGAVDTMPISITCPSDQSVNATSTDGAVVSYTPNTSGSCGRPTVTCSPVSGSTFHAGSTQVACNLRDNAGNTSQCAFKITVLSSPGGGDCTLNTYYQDSDGDGFGDLTQTAQSCTQPAGFVLAAGDNCPSKANSSQEDTDGEGIGNACDNCATVKNSNQVDDDNDKVGNACDNCMTTANENQLDSNSNGIGDACEPVSNTPPPASQSSSGGCSAVWQVQGTTPAWTFMVTLMVIGAALRRLRSKNQRS